MLLHFRGIGGTDRQDGLIRPILSNPSKAEQPDNLIRCFFLTVLLKWQRPRNRNQAKKGSVTRQPDAQSVS